MIHLNPKLAPYQVKILNLNLHQSLVIPWDCFDAGNFVKGKTKAISNGFKDFLLTATEKGVEVKCINIGGPEDAKRKAKRLNNERIKNDDNVN